MANLHYKNRSMLFLLSSLDQSLPNLQRIHPSGRSICLWSFIMILQLEGSPCTVKASFFRLGYVMITLDGWSPASGTPSRRRCCTLNGLPGRDSEGSMSLSSNLILFAGGLSPSVLFVLRAHQSSRPGSRIEHTGCGRRWQESRRAWMGHQSDNDNNKIK